jgi:hypothetical protein
MGWRLVRLHQCDRWEPIAAPSAGRTGSLSGHGEPAYAGHGPDLVIERLFGSGMRFTNGDTLVAPTPCLENGKTAYVDFLQETKLTGVRRNTSCCVLKHPSTFRTRTLPSWEPLRPAVSRYKAWQEAVLERIDRRSV